MDETRPSNGVDLALNFNQANTPFKQACYNLWQEQVVGDLIYNKGLKVCQQCLGFFSASDHSANHPPDYCVKVVQLCTEKRVTSAETFFKALWTEAMRLVGIYGIMWCPRMEATHVDSPVITHKGKEKNDLWLQCRVNLLEKQVLELESDKYRLMADKRTLQHRFDKLVERTLQDKGALDRIKLAAEGHLDALVSLLHPDGLEDSELPDPELK